MKSSSTIDHERTDGLLIENNSQFDSSNQGSNRSDPVDKKKKKKKEKKKERERKSPRSKDKDTAVLLGLALKDPPPKAENWASFDVAEENWASDSSEWNYDHSDVQVSSATQATEALTSDGSEYRDQRYPAARDAARKENHEQSKLVPCVENPEALASFHSEMLQGFLRRTGHDANVADATAASFERFLKQQHDIMNKLHGASEAGFNFDLDNEEDRLDCVESLADEAMADSFAPDSIWDQETAFDEKARMVAEFMQQNEFQLLSPSPKRSYGFNEKALMMAEFMQEELAGVDGYEDYGSVDLAAFHGDKLHDFLHRHGQNDEAAEQTAFAFKEFLKKQQEALSRISGGGSSGSIHSSIDGSRSAFSEPIPSVGFSSNSNELESDLEKLNLRGQLIRRSSRGSVHSSRSDDGGNLKARNILTKFQSDGTGMSGVLAWDERKLSASKERSIQEQMKGLTTSQLSCVNAIREKSKGKLDDVSCLRFARCSDFNTSLALKVMKKSPSIVQLSIASMENLLRTMLIYPLPGVMGRDGTELLYMRFSRLLPRSLSLASFSELVCYVLNCMHEVEVNCVNGIGIIADMSEFTMTNFSIPYMSKFLMLIQGRVFPVKVKSVMFVNPPQWFGRIWTVMKQMMSSDFLKTKVCKISIDEMVLRHLEPGWEPFMTNDMFIGKRNAKAIVSEFIGYRREIERSRILGGVRSDLS